MSGGTLVNCRACERLLIYGQTCTCGTKSNLPAPAVASALRLYANGLLSKWGFGDGDIVDDFLWDHLDYDDDVIHARLKDVDDHAVLRRLVREHLVPALESAGHEVEVYDIETNHNPVRAERLDGVDVDWDVIVGQAPEPQLRLQYVDVPLDVVLRAAGLEISA